LPTLLVAFPSNIIYAGPLFLVPIPLLLESHLLSHPPPNALESFWRLQSLLKSSDIYTHSGNVFMKLTTPPLITGLRPHIGGTSCPDL
jgi:hypothetical protein